MTGSGLVDFHSHLIPGVDDGARDVAQARSALVSFRGQDVNTVITTPHFDASYTVSYTGGGPRTSAVLERFDEGWEDLVEMADGEFPDLRLERGAEVKLDVPSPDLSDPRLRLAGTRFVLVEFPFFQVPPHGDTQIAQLSRKGWRPVLAHPERYRGLERRPEAAGSWRDAGAFLQVNSGSLVGDYGPGPRKLAFELLVRGWVDYVASDYHARGEPSLRRARELLAENGGREQARLLMGTNPARLLEEREPLLVPRLSKPGGFWGRILNSFR